MIGVSFGSPQDRLSLRADHIRNCEFFATLRSGMTGLE
jgi:hypothetical protein